MKELLALTENFSVSRPIFKLTKEDMHDRITVNQNDPVHRWTPIPEEGNVLSELVCKNYNETFSTRVGEFSIDKFAIANRSMENIRSSMAKFIEKNLSMKSPRQSKIYRWYYRNLPNSDDFNEAMVMVYKYLRSFCDEDMAATMTSQAHVDNTLALLEAIMEKYEEQR